MNFHFPHHPEFSARISAKIIPTPVGEMLACANDDGVILLEFLEKKNLQKELDEISKSLKANINFGEHNHLILLESELENYFKGDLKDFSVPLNPVGTEFQKKVWEILRQIPYGETKSYTEQSEIMGNPKAIRAVANANGQNKISILIPCHRVIGSNGTLTGYSGGIERKKKLLQLEKAVLF